MSSNRRRPCECGSGKRYNRCHGRPAEASTFQSFDFSALIEKQRAADREHRRLHGAVKAPITTEWNGQRIVATGKTLHFVPAANNKKFIDFLTTYLMHRLFDEETFYVELKKELQIRHPAMQWYSQFIETVTPENNATKLGSAHAWFRLAYDLYLIEHNAELQTRIIDRLRHPDSFQGARFEAAVAAMMLTAGYELAFSDESGRRPGAQTEFIATHRSTGDQLAVEAKSRHRPGIMQSLLGAIARRPEVCRLDGLIGDALSKNPDQPMLIFVEANVPDSAVQADAAYAPEIRTSWDNAQAEEREQGFPAIGLVTYNDTSPWYPTTNVPNDGFIWTLPLASSNRHGIDAKKLLMRLHHGVMQRNLIPEDYPRS